MTARSSIAELDLRRFAPLAAPLLQGTAASGFGPRAARNRAGAGLEFLDTRRYEPGDDIRKIDWRQSARSRDLVIRRFRDETAADWFICVDCSASVGWGERKWPAIVQLATALAYTLLYAGHRVAVVLFSDRVRGMCELGRGAHHYASILSTLAAGEPSARDKRSNLGLCRPLISSNSNIFVLSDFLQPDGMRPDLKSIRSRAASVNALQVLDVDEVRVPIRAIVALHDVESGEIRHVSASDDLEQRAANRLRSHSEALATDCARIGIQLTNCDTEQSWQQMLLEHLRR
jgi:uncharacterized protein (DUF58 family)